MLYIENAPVQPFDGRVEAACLRRTTSHPVVQRPAAVKTPGLITDVRVRAGGRCGAGCNFSLDPLIAVSYTRPTRDEGVSAADGVSRHILICAAALGTTRLVGSKRLRERTIKHLLDEFSKNRKFLAVDFSSRIIFCDSLFG